MKEQLLKLIDVQTSPLISIVSIANPDYPRIRRFIPGINACHIGKGYILTCAHHLLNDMKIPMSLSNHEFEDNILIDCNNEEKDILKNAYKEIPELSIRMAHIPDPKNVEQITQIFKRIKYDTRIDSLHKKNICQPFAIIQFDKPEFFGDKVVPARFPENRRYKQPIIEQYSFLIEVEQKYVSFDYDIAIFKIKNLDADIIDRIPSIDIAFDLHLPGDKLYCLQTSPTASNLGKMITEYHIDGLFYESLVENDPNYGFNIRKGIRYFADGFVRLGTSGSPVLSWDDSKRRFKVNAVASEACNNPVIIKDKKNITNNIVKVVCTPLAIVENQLTSIINGNEITN